MTRMLLVVALYVSLQFGFETSLNGQGNVRNARSEEAVVQLRYNPSKTSPSRIRFRALAKETAYEFDLSKLKRTTPNTTKFFFLEFGSSKRVIAVAYDPKTSQLWIDRNRDRQFSQDESVSADVNNRWKTHLLAEFLLEQDRFETERRNVEFYWDSKIETLTMGIRGSMRGKLNFEGHEIDVVRTDDNSNGRWADSADRFWIDFDGNGKFEPFTERFECQAFLNHAGIRYVVFADDRGATLNIDNRFATGSIGLSFENLDDGTKVEEVYAQLVSRSGISVRINQPSSVVEVPVAKYRIAELRIKMESSGKRYEFQFASKSNAEFEWLSVEKGKTAAIDPFGELTLTASRLIQRSGSMSLTLNPMVSTETGMYLTLSRIGTSSALKHNCAVATATVGDRTIGVVNSGFL